MPLVNLKTILSDTLRNRYAVGGFNFNDLDDVKGIIQAASEKQSPVIVMSSSSTARYIGVKTIVGMVKGLADSVNIPVCLHLDHATDLDLIFECIRAGYPSVMIDASAKPYQENIETTKRVVTFAKQYGCSVEAELGTIGGREEEISSDAIHFTNPADVPYFVEQTQIDALAVAVGTVHGFYKSEPRIDFDRIKEIRSLTDIPLVLHGGTGISPEDFQKAILCGINKINVGTELKYAFSSTLQEAASRLNGQDDPRKYMAMVTEYCSKIVKNKIDIFCSYNRYHEDWQTV